MKLFLFLPTILLTLVGSSLAQAPDETALEISDSSRLGEEEINSSRDSTAEQPVPTTTGLASMSQQERDTAAELLRDTFVSSPESNWTALVADMDPGMTKSTVLEMLRPFEATVEWGAGSGFTHTEAYRLDDAWLLSCAFSNGNSNGSWSTAFPKGSFTMADATLISAKLTERLRHVQIEPPANFTGLWITYFANGNQAQESSYENGKVSESTVYYSDGPKSYVTHHDHQTGDGAMTGFFHSGRTKYHGLYEDGKQVGTWTWFNEDGSIKSTKDYSEPESTIELEQ